MLTAHLPSGYVLARTWQSPVPYLLPAALIGAVVPDLDMIWFFLVDDQQIHHHRYWVHIPLFWAVVAAVTLAVLRKSRWFSTAIVFFCAVFLHLLLDTLSGGIMWAVPFGFDLISFVTVPAHQPHWVLSFLLHWTFLLELVIWAIAIGLFYRRSA